MKEHPPTNGEDLIVSKDRLTATTKGPVRRVVTIVGLVAAGLALLMTIAMVVVALGGFSGSALRLCFLVWVLSLFTVFGVTRYLKSGEDSLPRDESTE